MTTRAVLLALPVLALGWIAVLAGTAFALGAAPAYLVIHPGTLPEDVAVADASRLGLVIAPREATGGPDLPRALYAGGAWLVLPAGLPGCGG